MEQGFVIVVNDDRIQEVSAFSEASQAEEYFLDYCKTYLSNFDEYTQEDIEAILENGYESFGNGFIAIHWF